MPHCLYTTLSICHTVYLPHCLSATLSICHTVHLPHCLSSTLSVCHTVYLPHCLSVTLSIFRTVYLPHCLSATLLICHTVYLPHCLSATLSISLLHSNCRNSASPETTFLDRLAPHLSTWTLSSRPSLSTCPHRSYQFTFPTVPSPRCLTTKKNCLWLRK